MLSVLEGILCSIFTLSSSIPMAWVVVIQRVEPVRVHKRRAIQHSVVQLTLGIITE